MSEPDAYDSITASAIIYIVICIIAFVGNIITCVVIVYNHFMHTPTNYYLFNLAIGDMLMAAFSLISWVYMAIYHMDYIGTEYCIIKSYIAEFAMHGSTFIITAVTIERYLAICHPFISPKISELARTVKFIIAIWIMSACLAVPTAIRFFVDECFVDNQVVTSIYHYVEYAFEVNFAIVFVFPMAVIVILYILIARRLKEFTETSSSYIKDQKKIYKILVAVAVSFFICWAPFHCNRIFYDRFMINGTDPEREAYVLITFYMVMPLYFISTAINPILYSVMSKKFRKAFLSTFSRKYQPGTSEPVTSSWKVTSFDDKNANA